MGGVNAAGRTSGFQGFHRMVIDLLPESEQQKTLVALAVMMKLVKPEGDAGFLPIADEALNVLPFGSLRSPNTIVVKCLQGP
jgi:acetoacetyl-[acyl-carrier protein] synthase